MRRIGAHSAPASFPPEILHLHARVTQHPAQQPYRVCVIEVGGSMAVLQMLPIDRGQADCCTALALRTGACLQAGPHASKDGPCAEL